LRNYRECGEALARTVAIFRRLVGTVTVTKNQDRSMTIVLDGPIAHVDNESGSGAASIQLTVPHIRRNPELWRRNTVDLRTGKLSLTDEDWLKIKPRLPTDDIWVENFATPLSFRSLLDAAIFMKRTRITVGSLPDDFGPSQQVAKALRILNYWGILELAQSAMMSEGITLVDGIELSRDKRRTPRPDILERHVRWNERRKDRVSRVKSAKHALKAA
jgi:hypothetical protein